jgi:hypothetical protein
MLYAPDKQLNRNIGNRSTNLSHMHHIAYIYLTSNRSTNLNHMHHIAYIYLTSKGHLTLKVYGVGVTVGVSLRVSLVSLSMRGSAYLLFQIFQSLFFKTGAS